MNNNLPDSINEILRTGFLEIEAEKIKVSGFSNVNNLILLKKIIEERKFSKTLEVGLAYGGSATVILSALEKNSTGEYSHTAIDPYQSSWMGGFGVKHVEKLGFSSNFNFKEDFSELVLPKLLSEGEKFDLIYIDGSHLFDNVFLDAYYAYRLLNINGILVFDDCADTGVFKAINFLKKSNPTSLKKIDVRKYLKFSFLKNIVYPFASKTGKVQLQVFEKTAEEKHYWGK